MEYAVLHIHELSEDAAQQYMDPELLQTDIALSVLRNPRNHTDQEVFFALNQLGGSKIENSPVIRLSQDRGSHLFSEAWRRASEGALFRGQDLFTACFGRLITRRWYPLSNVLYYRRDLSKEQTDKTEYHVSLDPCRSCHFTDGIWYMEGYERLSFDPERLQGFLHGTDLQLRRYLKTGRYLKERPKEGWTVPYLQQVIAEDQRSGRDEMRRLISIDLSGLNRIREDARVTQERLIMEEPQDISEESVFMEQEPDLTSISRLESDTEVAFRLDPFSEQVLRMLIREEDPSEIIHSHHLTPSMAADSINEDLFEEIGDIVVSCEADILLLIEDYIEDIRMMLE